MTQDDPSPQDDDSRLLVIPPGLDFATLELALDPHSGDISFNWEPLEQICEASGIDLDALMEESEDALSELITAWYEAHIEAGGAPDDIQERLMREAEEDTSS